MEADVARVEVDAKSVSAPPQARVFAAQRGPVRNALTALACGAVTAAGQPAPKPQSGIPIFGVTSRPLGRRRRSVRCSASASCRTGASSSTMPDAASSRSSTRRSRRPPLPSTPRPGRRTATARGRRRSSATWATRRHRGGRRTQRAGARSRRARRARDRVATVGGRLGAVSDSVPDGECDGRQGPAAGQGGHKRSGRWFHRRLDIDRAGQSRVATGRHRRCVHHTAGRNRQDPPEDGKRVVTTIIQPVPSQDSWAVLSDGTIAFVRARDYHIDWILPDGTKTSTAKLPFDWKRLTDEDKQKLADSAKVVWDSLMTIRNKRNAGPATSGRGEGWRRPSQAGAVARAVASASRDHRRAAAFST